MTWLNAGAVVAPVLLRIRLELAGTGRSRSSPQVRARADAGALPERERPDALVVEGVDVGETARICFDGQDVVAEVQERRLERRVRLDQLEDDRLVVRGRDAREVGFVKSGPFCQSVIPTTFVQSLSCRTGSGWRRGSR